MAEYRLYFVDEHGAPLGAFSFTSADDQLAMEAARQFGCERGADLCCGTRTVMSWRTGPTVSPEPPTAEHSAAPW